MTPAVATSGSLPAHSCVLPAWCAAGKPLSQAQASCSAGCVPWLAAAPAACMPPQPVLAGAPPPAWQPEMDRSAASTSGGTSGGGRRLLGRRGAPGQTSSAAGSAGEGLPPKAGAAGKRVCGTAAAAAAGRAALVRPAGASARARPSSRSSRLPRGAAPQPAGRAEQPRRLHGDPSSARPTCSAAGQTANFAAVFWHGVATPAQAPTRGGLHAQPTRRSSRGVSLAPRSRRGEPHQQLCSHRGLWCCWAPVVLLHGGTRACKREEGWALGGPLAREYCGGCRALKKAQPISWQNCCAPRPKAAAKPAYARCSPWEGEAGSMAQEGW